MSRVRILAVDDEPGMLRAIERVLQAHEPYPALAIDRTWTLVAANRAVAPLLAGAAPAFAAAAGAAPLASPLTLRICDCMERICANTAST